VSVARVLVDTNVFLSARSPREPGHASSRRLLDVIDDGGIAALVSVITLADELRAGFPSAQLPALWTPFMSHLRASPGYVIAPVDEPIALAAGELREPTRLSLPDALLLATAGLRGAACVATWDQDLLRARTTVPSRRPDDIQVEWDRTSGARRPLSADRGGRPRPGSGSRTATAARPSSGG
jgi:predicted nucleic acid-binding protein